VAAVRAESASSSDDENEEEEEEEAGDPGAARPPSGRPSAATPPPRPPPQSSAQAPAAAPPRERAAEEEDSGEEEEEEEEAEEPAPAAAPAAAPAPEPEPAPAPAPAPEPAPEPEPEAEPEPEPEAAPEPGPEAQAEPEPPIPESPSPAEPPEPDAPPVAAPTEEEELADLPPAAGAERAIPPSEAFRYTSAADSLLRMVNKFRETSKRAPLLESPDLFRVAMAHSRQMALGTEPYATDAIAAKLRDLPITHFFAAIGRENAEREAFTSVVNELTTDRKKSAALLRSFNAAGVGVAASANGFAYFTLIIGFRTIIGYSYYTGTSLRSIMLAERCGELVNHVRQKEFRLPPILLDLRLCDLAYSFVKMDYASLTEEYQSAQIGPVSDFRIAYGRVPAKSAAPAAIVENWMNLCGRTKNILGDFNRAGYGFHQAEGSNYLYSICVYMRSLHAAVIDGKETVIENDVLANRVAEILNEFREQYALPVLAVDPDLCETARKHAEFMANRQSEDDEGRDPLKKDPEAQDALRKYQAFDVTHMKCREIRRAPQEFMEKWRNTPDCVSVLLNQVDEIGVGACFDPTYECHLTVIIGSFGNDTEVTNVHYTF
jgi:uncharacterized protein YkwD